MENVFREVETGSAPAPVRRACGRLALAAVALAVGWGAAPATAQERIMFPAVDNAQAEILRLIRNETVRLYVSM